MDVGGKSNENWLSGHQCCAKIAENATTICITHHLGDLKTSDDVIYLDAGHIVEHGSFEELMAAKGTFYQQVNARGDE